MYRPVAFDMTDHAEIADFIDAAGPAHLVTMSREGLSASVMPLILDRSTNSLIGHLARPNPQWRSAGATASASSARTAALPTSTR
jgi:transcriptional regulator